MKLAFTTLACPGWSVARVIEAAREYGYQGVEWRLLDGEVIDPVRDGERLTDAVARCRAAGIEVPALDSSCRFNLVDAVEREAQIEDLRRWIALAGRLAVPVIRVFGGTDPAGSPLEDGTERVAEALARVATEAEVAGVTVALETHDGFSAASRVAHVLDRVPYVSLGALWDSHHPARMGESPVQVLDLLGGRIAHVHLKDARRIGQGDTWQLVGLGEGELPLRAMLDALAARGYDGWLSLEWEKKWHPELAEPEVALPAAARWLREAGARIVGA